MKKRTFLKRTSALAAGSMLAPLMSCESTPQDAPAEAAMAPRTNWAGNLTYRAEQVYYPNTEAEVQQFIRQCDKLRGLGSKHCFNAIADSPYNQLSLKNMNRVLVLDEATQTVTLQAGIRYGELSPYLEERGYALHNLASLPHISVAGACATATHGSGVGNGNLATAVVGMKFVDAAGEIHSLSLAEDGERFLGSVVHLGGMGIITELTLKVEPTYQVRQDVYQFLPLEELAANFDAILSAGYSVSLFTDYKTDKVNQVWIKSRMDAQPWTEAPAEFFGAQKADRDIHPIIDISAENCTEQMGVPGPWYDRLPHFKMEFTPSSGKELQTEYFVPRDRALEAIQAIHGIADQVSPLLMISEIRTIAADNFWMSPCYQQDSVTIHFTWEQDMEALQQLLPTLEATLEPFGAKPHWGKIFGYTGEELAAKYSQIDAFRDLLTEVDPSGKFRNEFLDQYIFDEGSV